MTDLPPGYTYRVVEAKDNPEETVIEKIGPVGTLTLSRIPQLLQQHKNEAAGEENKIAQCQQVMTQEEKDYPDVRQYLARTPVKSLHAIIRWGHAAYLMDGAKQKLALIEKAMQELRDEEAEIRKQTGILPKTEETTPASKPTPSSKKKHGKSR